MTNDTIPVPPPDDDGGTLQTVTLEDAALAIVVLRERESEHLARIAQLETELATMRAERHQ